MKISTIIGNNIKDFKVGQVYKMTVASRSHVKKPYYVQIVMVGEDFIKTSIPGEHSLIISKDNNWDYHIPRMRYVGNLRRDLALTEDQTLTHVN